MCNRIVVALLSLLLVNMGLKTDLFGQMSDHRNTSGLEGASWIGEPGTKVLPDSMLFSDHPAPMFRREFLVPANLKEAVLTIAAAGYYKVSLNGEELKENVLDPAWTNFSKRVFSNSYNITELIKPGINTIGTMLGNGFYNLLPLRMFGKNLRDFLPTGQPRFVAKIELTYTNGKTERIYSNQDWKTAAGPVMRNNVYLGMVYDARNEMKGWNLSGFDDHQWKNAAILEDPGGTIQPSFFKPVRIARHIPAVRVYENKNMAIVDMGINLTGLYKIRLKGKSGDTIRFRFGERVYEDGSLNPMTTVAGQIKRKGAGGKGAPDIAWQTDSYIFGDQEKTWFQPCFTFHTFRYIEISGLKYLPEKSDVEAIEFHSAVENGNNFYSSSDLLNRIQSVCRQTFLSNLISVQSDCPAREKFGYGGDLNATNETFICNFDMHSFYRKTIYDWVDAMKDSIFIDTAPYVGIKYCGISWESAFLITQYRLFQYNGDTAIVDEMYLRDLQWMEKVNRLHPNGIVDSGLSDHESLIKVPVQLIGTTHYLECARIMKQFARIKRDKSSFKRFEKLEKSLTRKLQDQFWYKPVADPINRQTLFATLIYYKLIPEKELKAATDSLLNAVRRAPAGHFVTGIFGTKYILEALSMTGHIQEVFDIVNSTTYPGWGHMLDRGATTLWETWKESDNTYSNCHPMFGTVSEWYYRWLAGIRPMEGSTGFRKFIIEPGFPVGLDQAGANYDCPSGTIKVDWKRAETGRISGSITIPDGCFALFKPARNTQKAWKVTNVNTLITTPFRSGNGGFELSGGVYQCDYQ